MREAIFEIDELRFAWPGSSTLCLDIDALRVAKGETLFLFGPSGCGKSTLLALIGKPALVIADEPTSALDEQRRDDFLDLLLSACRTADSALVFVSHDLRTAERFERAVAVPQINRASMDNEAWA